MILEHRCPDVGDVKRLPNAYSNQGVVLELDESWQTVREMSSDPMGYLERRTTLYGPPPPYVK